MKGYLWAPIPNWGVSLRPLRNLLTDCYTKLPCLTPPLSCTQQDGVHEGPHCTPWEYMRSSTSGPTKGDHETSITTRVHSRLVLPQVKAEHGTSRHALHPEFRVPLSPPRDITSPQREQGTRGVLLAKEKTNVGWVGGLKKKTPN